VKDGALVLVTFCRTLRPPTRLLEKALADSGGELVREIVIADGPVLSHPRARFGLSFVPGKDGVKRRSATKRPT